MLSELSSVMFGVALTLLCLGVVFNDYVTHRLHRLRKRRYDDRCTICTGTLHRPSTPPDSPHDRDSHP